MERKEFLNSTTKILKGLGFSKPSSSSNNFYIDTNIENMKIVFGLQKSQWADYYYTEIGLFFTDYSQFKKFPKYYEAPMRMRLAYKRSAFKIKPIEIKIEGKKQKIDDVDYIQYQDYDYITLELVYKYFANDILSEYLHYGLDDIKRIVLQNKVFRCIEKGLYSYLNLPTPKPYVKKYDDEDFKNDLKHYTTTGGFVILNVDEYNNHKEYYDKLAVKGAHFYIVDGTKFTVLKGDNKNKESFKNE